MSHMRQTVTTVTTTSSANHENNLDALLDDLQSSISRSGSNANMNGTVSGYREVRRTVQEGTGPATTHYQIEYLHPANSTTHITETHHNALPNSIEYGGPNMTTHKEYKYSTEGSGDMRMRHNISELDSLLDDLHASQQNSFSDNTSMIAHRGTPGVDPGLLEPISGGSPHVSRSIERHYREEKKIRGRSSSPASAKRELVFTGGRSLDPSPVRHQTFYEEQRGPTRQQVYRYEKTTTTRTTAPTITDITPVDGGGPRSYNYTTSEEPLPITYRSPSPANQGYHYSSSPPPPQTVERVEKVTKYSTGGYPDRRDPSPQMGYPGSKTMTTYNYNSSSSRESRPEVGRTPPPPHRSPSPVSFAQPPPPPVGTKTTVKTTYHYDGAPRSPSPQKFSPSDPSRTLTYSVSPPPPPQQTVTTYRYTTTSSSSGGGPRYPEEVPLLGPRPFPNPSPSPTPEQQPPKKLDDLMASFTDTDVQMQSYHSQDISSSRYDPHPDPGLKESRPSSPPEKIVQSNKIVEKKDETKNVVGPPVYYPPGELFTKKEESMSQKQSGGGKYKEKSMYEYEASSKSKSKESSGKTVVPVCIPLCCGMPCVIM